jgi:PKD repeat protein
MDGTAIGGDDYVSVAGNTVMIKGEKCRVYGHAVVEMIDDVCLEEDETVYVKLTGAYVDDGQQTPLTITDNGAEGLIQNDDVAPVADFMACQTVGSYGSLCVQFKNLSTNADEWLWDFGDGTYSTNKNPYHCFYNPPHKWYDIKLTAICEDHHDVELKTRYITVHAAPDVAFNATPIAGTPGMEVQFTNNSGGSANHWWWDFGNGHAEVLQHGVMDMVHPVSTYMDEGSYSAGLYGYGNGGEDLFVVPNFIYVDSFFVDLKLEGGSDTVPGEGWDNAIDHDVISSNAPRLP